jgi:hypothetical protein
MKTTLFLSMCLRRRAASVLLLMLLPALAQAVTLNIPATHPRNWYGNAARLTQARTHYQSTPFTPSGEATTLNFGRALRGLLTNNNTDCDQAVSYLATWEAPAGIGGFRDATRQQGEALLLIYDWCHHRLSPSQITTLVARWNGYMDRDNGDDFANEGSEANNYFWGRVRNNLLWGIASFGENPRAQAFIDNALETRLGDWFPGWYQDFGRGGVFPEGADYGSVTLSYPIVPFQSAADFGYDPYAQTPYFREAIYALIYGTTPGPTRTTGVPPTGNVLFPFNDDATFFEGSPINVRNYYGDVARFFGQRNAASGNARHMRAWLTATSASRSWMFDALGGSGQATDLNALPLDYFAPGAAVFYTRSGHDANASALHIQLGTPGGVQHRHRDAGNFQFWRKGRWITRESVGYSKPLAAFGGNGTVDTEHHVAHNGLLFQGRTTGRWVGTGPIVIPAGDDRGDQPDGLPEVVRVQHHPDFGYVATDFSRSYRNTNGRRVDWPYADKAVREFLFVRRFNALVILDRMRTSSDSQLPFYMTANWINTIEGTGTPDPLAVHVPAPNVVRTFLMHFETPPTLSANRASAVVGEQVADLITLLPASATYRVINEDVAGAELYGQHRLELDSSGTTESYFLNVVHGRDVGTTALAANLTDNGASWTLTLTDPQQGTASIVLQKGMASSGGSVAFGAATPVALNPGVQGIQVTNDGPVWASLVDAIFADDFE